MTGNDRFYSEKRDFIRMQVETHASLVVNGQTIDALCLDLSSAGMQLVADTRLQVGDQVRVHIPSSHNALKGLNAEAEVVRADTAEDGRQTLGLAILSMD